MKNKDIRKKIKSFKGTEYYIALFPTHGIDENDIKFLGENNTMVSTMKQAIAFNNIQEIIHNVNLEEIKESPDVADVTIIKSKYEAEML
jgi:hypothetical protein